MSYARYLVAFFLLVLPAALARADGLLCQLPKDGSWATYDLDMGTKMPGGEVAKAKGTVWLASVGQTIENGEPCRWIEVEFKITMTMGEHKREEIEVNKLLIPEKYLAKGESPLEHVLRAWMKHGEAAPRKLEKPNSIDAGPLPLVLSGPWKDAKQLDKAAVDCKLGKVACAGVQGTLEFKIHGGNMKCKLEKRLHADSPFGVAASRWTLEMPDGPSGMGAMDWNLKLVDFGENAKSKMPDSK
jgi:hypothetical protein